jgi:hypothetical protein
MKRYTTIVDFYIYAENDDEAKEEAKRFAKQIDTKMDNKCKVLELHYTPFGSIKNRKIEL